MSSSTNPPPSSNAGLRDTSLTDCLLSQYRLCAAGIGLGTAYSLKYKKGLAPMIAAGAVGTTADMVYAYLVECSEFTSSKEEIATTKSTKSNDSSSTSEINGS
eukprot:CAMPEP_0197276910 /NCGR_PEP_ID=MMETSP1432-20130617/16174_1 /TAXON_ID=44447 /ORGANISM="Pseudo-nitzschia delicatissima, Strain UNC1205" /LENGTH=102 /DNA_ID=CAMNT_0042743033 /DNA_START=51 /DNA_END=359 /DNA_ORIENTATION=+